MGDKEAGMNKIILDTGVELNAHPTSWKMALNTLRFIAGNNCLAHGAKVTIDGEERVYVFDQYKHVKRVGKEAVSGTTYA